MDYPYVIDLDPVVADDAHTTAEALMQVGIKMQGLQVRADELREELWKTLSKDPNIDVDKFLYNYNAENHVLTCEGDVDDDAEIAGLNAWLEDAGYFDD